LANSTPIRYSQLFQSRNDLIYYSNRGTSGIDGCTSTAMGSAYISKLPTILITGDLAFLYDSNAMWNNYIDTNFKIIVINNSGGNIFTLIDTSDEISSINNFFLTPQNVNINSLVQAFGLSFFQISSEKDSKKIVHDFFQSVKPSVLEIVTNPDNNTTVHKEYFNYLVL